MTGGERGNPEAMEGLRKVYYNPELFGVLPYKHNYTLTGDEQITSFFLPAFKTIKETYLLDKRGFITDEDGKQYFNKTRLLKQSDPEEYLTYCAEFCFTGEEAFSLEGDNKFNKINIAELLAAIRILKKCPPIDVGYLEYLYKDGKHVESAISGFRWIPNQASKLKILEHPIWTLPDEKDPETGKVIKTYPKDPIKGLYVVGIDGIDIGAAQTSDATRDPSDFCLVVKKRTFGLDEPKYVAIYKDRPNDVREAYKIAIKVALYYNAVINIEATRLSIIPWARERKLLNLFMKRPRATLTDSIRNNNKLYGTPATVAIIQHQTDLIADYVNDYCHTIWFEEILDELSRYDDRNKRKFDIVAALGMAELADEELSGVVPRAVKEEKNSWQDIGFYTDEEGRRRWGLIQKNAINVTINNNFDNPYEDFRPRTSDTRFYL